MLKKIVVPLLTLSVLNGCIAAAAGAGAEAAYVLSQEDRTASETLTDQRITSEVKTRLLADPAVAGLKINVDTHKSVVTLKGQVNSQREADEAARLAKNVAGVRSVNDQITVTR